MVGYFVWTPLNLYSFLEPNGLDSLDPIYNFEGSKHREVETYATDATVVYVHNTVVQP